MVRHFVITFFTSEGIISKALTLIYRQVAVDYMDTFRVLVPAALYLVQNNLLYVAISNLNAVAYQILYQSKIFTTAFFMVTMMGRRLFSAQWIALFLLFVGIVLSQAPISLTHLSSAPFESGILELMILERQVNQILTHPRLSVSWLWFAPRSAADSPASILRKYSKARRHPSGCETFSWVAIFGILIGLCGVFTYDRSAVLERGFFQGYTPTVWLVVLLQTFSGLGVAFVMKYADNILKGFAAGLSIILSSAISYLVLNDFTPSIATFAGAGLVIGATVLYGHVPQKRTEQNLTV
ncbi:solute carrier family 35 (UDP-sugar transporter), member A1/2/3 [Paragonimus westermani]|uniref:Solute carrier family 35 (UDP-sugar transporter), member A1/2/3 n=1 Tax=Paragonimus westermani TaxID=34504 RepID=A0A5J4NYJ0_9TREM|nr:solute carrier family 35 (UDP-sugar transporter), member A1/2/3 [Paragonimus westermani]